MYRIDSYALDLLAYTLILLCSDRQLSLDLLAYFSSDGHIMSLRIASQWFIKWSTQSAIYSCQGGLGRRALIVQLQLIKCGFEGWILLLQNCFE
jgi:hypothetical protein